MAITKSKTVSLVRDTIIVIIILFALVSLFELSLRLFFPQVVRNISQEHKSLGMKDNELGHFNQPITITTQTGPEYNVNIRINQEGLRDRTEHVSPKPPDKLRILLLGDSFTFGVGNNYQNIWSVIFERNLLDKGYNIDVVKAGVPEYDTSVELRLLERLFPKYQPNIVIMAFLPNDLFTNTRIGEPTYLDKKYSGDVSETSMSHLTSFLMNLHSVILIKRLLFSSDYLYTKLYLSTKRAQYFSYPMNETLKTQVALTKDLILKAKHYCERNGKIFLVLSIPQQFQVIAKARAYSFENIDVSLIDSVFSEFAQKNSFVWIPVLDVLADYYRITDHPLYYRYDGHLNPEGNRVVGTYLSKEFRHLFEQRLTDYLQSD